MSSDHNLPSYPPPPGPPGPPGPTGPPGVPPLYPPPWDSRHKVRTGLWGLTGGLLTGLVGLLLALGAWMVAGFCYLLWGLSHSAPDNNNDTADEHTLAALAIGFFVLGLVILVGSILAGAFSGALMGWATGRNRR